MARGQHSMYSRILFLLSVAFSLSASAVSIHVGSKANIENIILGEMATLIAEETVDASDHKAGLGGTQVVWKSLLRGDIDVYAEYTGTITQELLPDAHSSMDEVTSQLKAKGILMLPALGFNNTYALGITSELAKKYHLAKITDLLAHPELRFGFSHEFMDRHEGWPALKRVYGLPQQDVRGFEHEVTYLGLANREIDVTDLYSTDAEIKYYNLVTLIDDRELFPKYNALYLYRADLETKAPQFVAKLKELSGKIGDAQMTELNAHVKLDKKRERNVAEAFLVQNGILKRTHQTPTNQSSIWLYTKQHLSLVCISLFFTILVAVPMGVLASLRPAFGEVILALTGVVQTIPSLALLVFMIPFLGIGPKPALVALFLYGLLPILRSTYTGLRQIPPNLLESAEALGLPRWVRLWRVELPLASRSILSGIKTSAVINVGTATLGAIIGAGGYGEPILMGIRKDDMNLILQGAIPAAVLAILVQMLFQYSERFLIPKGLVATS